jgi:hypothetical protein
MLMQFSRILYGHVPVEVHSAFSLQTSVRRLQDATERSVFSRLFRRAAVGRVTATAVRLKRAIPGFSNPFRPIFMGRFEEVNGHVILKGIFTMAFFTKIFVSIWFGSVALLIAAILLMPFMRPSVPLLEFMDPLPVLGLFFLGILFVFVRFGWMLSRNDMDYLTAIMTEALQKRSGRHIKNRDGG